MDDVAIAKKYLSKRNDAISRGLTFSLTFTAFKNMMRAKKCAYTGVVLTECREGKKRRATDRTIERKDASKGYEVGNCVACCDAANGLKARVEHKSDIVDKQFLINLAKHC